MKPYLQTSIDLKVGSVFMPLEVGQKSGLGLPQSLPVANRQSQHNTDLIITSAVPEKMSTINMELCGDGGGQKVIRNRRGCCFVLRIWVVR